MGRDAVDILLRRTMQSTASCSTARDRRSIAGRCTAACLQGRRRCPHLSHRPRRRSANSSRSQAPWRSCSTSSSNSRAPTSSIRATIQHTSRFATLGLSPLQSYAHAAVCSRVCCQSALSKPMAQWGSVHATTDRGACFCTAGLWAAIRCAAGGGVWLCPGPRQFDGLQGGVSTFE